MIQGLCQVVVTNLSTLLGPVVVEITRKHKGAYQFTWKLWRFITGKGRNIKSKTCTETKRRQFNRRAESCVRLAQLHAQLMPQKLPFNFAKLFPNSRRFGWQKKKPRGCWSLKIYAKAGQIEDAELFMKEHLTTNDPLKNSWDCRCFKLK